MSQPLPPSQPSPLKRGEGVLQPTDDEALTKNLPLKALALPLLKGEGSLCANLMWPDVGRDMAAARLRNMPAVVGRVLEEDEGKARRIIFR